MIYGTKTCAISDRHLDYGPQSLSNCGGASLRKGAKAFLYGAKDGRFPKSCLLFETCTETTGGNADYNLYKSIVKGKFLLLYCLSDRKQIFNEFLSKKHHFLLKKVIIRSRIFIFGVKI